MKKVELGIILMAITMAIRQVDAKTMVKIQA
jgi:hypothetical protein